MLIAREEQDEKTILDLDLRAATLAAPSGGDVLSPKGLRELAAGQRWDTIQADFNVVACASARVLEKHDVTIQRIVTAQNALRSFVESNRRRAASAAVKPVCDKQEFQDDGIIATELRKVADGLPEHLGPDLHVRKWLGEDAQVLHTKSIESWVTSLKRIATAIEYSGRVGRDWHDDLCWLVGLLNDRNIDLDKCDVFPCGLSDLSKRFVASIASSLVPYIEGRFGAFGAINVLDYFTQQTSGGKVTKVSDITPVALPENVSVDDVDEFAASFAEDKFIALFRLGGNVSRPCRTRPTQRKVPTYSHALMRVALSIAKAAHLGLACDSALSECSGATKLRQFDGVRTSFAALHSALGDLSLASQTGQIYGEGLDATNIDDRKPGRVLSLLKDVLRQHSARLGQVGKGLEHAVTESKLKECIKLSEASDDGKTSLISVHGAVQAWAGELKDLPELTSYREIARGKGSVAFVQRVLRLHAMSEECGSIAASCGIGPDDFEWPLAAAKQCFEVALVMSALDSYDAVQQDRESTGSLCQTLSVDLPPCLAPMFVALKQ